MIQHSQVTRRVVCARRRKKPSSQRGVFLQCYFFSLHGGGRNKSRIPTWHRRLLRVAPVLVAPRETRRVPRCVWGTVGAGWDRPESVCVQYSRAARAVATPLTGVRALLAVYPPPFPHTALCSHDAASDTAAVTATPTSDADAGSAAARRLCAAASAASRWSLASLRPCASCSAYTRSRAEDAFRRSA